CAGSRPPRAGWLSPDSGWRPSVPASPGPAGVAVPALGPDPAALRAGVLLFHRTLSAARRLWTFPDPPVILPEDPGAERTRPKGRPARGRPGRMQWRHRLPRPEQPAPRGPPALPLPATPGARPIAAPLPGEWGQRAGSEGLPERRRVRREPRRASAAGDAELAKKSRGDAGAARLAP